MDDKDEAEKAILEAEKEKAEMLRDASEDGFVISAIVIEKFDRLIAQAKELLAKTNYQGAEQLAEQAKESLEKEEDKIESLEEEMEETEDLEDNEEQEKFEKNNDRGEKEQSKNDDDSLEIEDAE